MSFKGLASRGKICYDGVVKDGCVIIYLCAWGCRVSTDAQVEELQAEVSVCTLVKQPTKK